MRKIATQARGFAVGIVFGIIALPGTGFAEKLEFRVAMENLPGVSDVLSGKFDTGIRKLENLLRDEDSLRRGEVLATLCGVYVLATDYDRAEATCERAVEERGDDMAYNNRGVLRVHRGDMQGAARDFEMARPPSVDEHLERIWSTNPGLIAVGNTEKLGYLEVRLSDRRSGSAPGTVTASIENLGE